MIKQITIFLAILLLAGLAPLTKWINQYNAHHQASNIMIKKMTVLLALLMGTGCDYLAKSINDYAFHNPSPQEKWERSFRDDAEKIVTQHGPYASADLLIEQYRDLLNEHPESDEHRWEGVLAHFLLNEKRYSEALQYLEKLQLHEPYPKTLNKYDQSLYWMHLFANQQQLTYRQAMFAALSGLHDPRAAQWK